MIVKYFEGHFVKQLYQQNVNDAVVKEMWRKGEHGISYVGIDENTQKVIGAGGLERKSDHYLAWLWLTPEIQKRPVELVRTVKQVLDGLVLDFGIEQIICTITLDDSGEPNWVERKKKFAHIMGFLPYALFTYMDDRPGELFMERTLNGSRH